MDLPLSSIAAFDERRDWIVFETQEEAIAFAAEHWIHAAKRAIQRKGRFCVALSGGSTPKPVYEIIARSRDIDWSSVFLFWSDERAVPPNAPESNYRMAMEAGFDRLPIPPSQIFRMHGEKEPSKAALLYEEALKKHLFPSLFDLVLLGMGEDGHTASLFPGTPALLEKERLVFANPVGQGKGDRLTLTFPCIEKSEHAVIMAWGEKKAEIAAKALAAPLDSPFPVSRVGSVEKKALWILDRAAAKKMEDVCK